MKIIKDFKNNKFDLSELTNNRSASIVNMPDFIISNIYTDIYKREGRTKKAEYKLFNNKITIRDFNNGGDLPGSDREYRGSEAQTFIDKKKNIAAIAIWSTPHKNYWNIASTIKHEDGHAFHEIDINKRQSTAGQYETMIYWHELSSDIFNNLSSKSQYNLKHNKFIPHLNKLLSAGTQSRPKPSRQIKKDLKMFEKYLKLYEKKFKTKLVPNGFGGVRDKKRFYVRYSG